MYDVLRQIQLDHYVQPGPQFDAYQGNRIDAFTTDVDGTYVPDNTLEVPSGPVSREVYAALQSGLHVRLQTARGLGKTAYLINDLFETIELTHSGDYSLVRYHGLSNGAQIYDGLERQMSAEYPLPLPIADEIVHYLQREEMPHWVSDNGEADYEPVDLPALKLRFHDLGLGAYRQIDDNLGATNYIPDNPLVIVAHDLDQARFEEVMAYGASFNDRGVTAIEYGATGEGDAKRYKVFILHKFANKQHAMGVIADRSGIEIANTLVVGDSSNDAVMLRTAVEHGGVGASMGNGTAVTKAEATVLVPEQAKDGAAYALRLAQQLRTA